MLNCYVVMLYCYTSKKFCYYVKLCQFVTEHILLSSADILVNMLLYCSYALRSSKIFPRLVDDDMLNYFTTISLCIGSQPNSCGGGDEDYDSQCYVIARCHLQEFISEERF